MAKKKNKQAGTGSEVASQEEAVNAAAAAEDFKIDDTGAPKPTDIGDPKAAAGASEEQKVDAEIIYKQQQQATPAEKPQGPLRKNNSRFDLNKPEEGEAEQESTAPLYRPEFGRPANECQEKMWELMSSYIGSDQRSIQRSIVNHVEYTLARTRFNFDNKGAYQAAAYSVRDRLIEAWNDTQQFHTVSV